MEGEIMCRGAFFFSSLLFSFFASDMYVVSWCAVVAELPGIGR